MAIIGSTMVHLFGEHGFIQAMGSSRQRRGCCTYSAQHKWQGVHRSMGWQQAGALDSASQAADADCCSGLHPPPHLRAVLLPVPLQCL